MAHLNKLSYGSLEKMYLYKVLGNHLRFGKYSLADK